MKYLLIWTIGLMVLFGCQSSPTSTPSIPNTQLDKQLSTLMDSFELMGMSVIVIDADTIAYEGYFGWADSMRQLPIQQQTLYRIASISKLFTTTALMQLYEKGRVDLDADVSQYLGWNLHHPKYPNTPITLRLLMSHRSGMADGSKYYAFAGDMIEQDLNLTDLFTPAGAYYTDDLFSSHEPGSYFAYANCTWSIIATIIEKVSGERFDQYCRQHIFEPLGMSASFNPRDIPNIDDLAILYRVYPNGQWKPQKDSTRGQTPPLRAKATYVPGTNGLLFGPQGNLRASAKDLAIFAQVLLHQGSWKGQQILAKESLDMMRSAQWMNEGDNGDTWDGFIQHYGLGTHIITASDSADIVFPGRSLFGHAGIAYGLLSDFYLDPDRQQAVIFITNGSKHPWKKAAGSSFYAVEAAVFSAIQTGGFCQN